MNTNIIKRAKRLYYTGKEEPIFWGDLPRDEQAVYIKLATEAKQCNAVVWRRDTLRRTGRGKSGFEMHYNRGRCKRSAACGDLCTQHTEQEKWRTILRYEK